MSEEQRIKTSAEYLEAVSAIKNQWPNSALAFRGQENEEWPLASSAERRLRASSTGQDKLPNQLFVEYHENLLGRCKLKNYDKRENNQLDELDLLADLQHYGAATCLLDFTRNALVALWFACQKSDADGKVFVVNTADEKTFLEIASGDIKDKSIKDVLQFNTRPPSGDQTTKSQDEPSLWCWPPAHLNERITAQHSLFLFGVPSSMELQLKPEKIVIESASKEQIRHELKELHNLHEESLFPDFIGFAYTQRHNAPYDTPDTTEYVRRGSQENQRGQYSKAIESYTKRIELQPDDARAYYNRGSIYRSLGERDLAMQDFDKAIGCYDRRIQHELDIREPYFLRGNVKAEKQDYVGARQDYDLAVDRSDKPYSNLRTNVTVVNDFELFMILFNRANAKVEMQDYEGALEDYDAAIKHNPEPFRTDLGPIYFNRANVKVHLCRFQEATKDYDEAIRIGFLDAYVNKGNVLVRLGHFDEALQCYDKWAQEKKQKGDSFGNRDAIKSILEKIDGRKFETTTSDKNGLMLIQVQIANCSQESQPLFFQGNAGNVGNFGGNRLPGGKGYPGQIGFAVQIVGRKS